MYNSCNRGTGAGVPHSSNTKTDPDEYTHAGALIQEEGEHARTPRLVADDVEGWQPGEQLATDDGRMSCHQLLYPWQVILGDCLWK